MFRSKIIRAAWLLMAILLVTAVAATAQNRPAGQSSGVAVVRRAPGGAMIVRRDMMLRSGGPGGMGAFRRGPFGLPIPPLFMLARQLHLTPAQRTQLGAIVFNARKSQIRTHADLAIAQLTLRRLLQAQTPDQAAILAQVNAIGALRTRQMTNGIKALLAGEAVLTPAQRLQARRLLLRHAMMMRMMRQRRASGGNVFFFHRRFNGGWAPRRPGAFIFRDHLRPPAKPQGPPPPPAPGPGAEN